MLNLNAALDCLHLLKSLFESWNPIGPHHAALSNEYKRFRRPSLCSEGIWLSGKTLDCRPRDCKFDPPSLQLKLLKGDMYWFFPGKMLPCISALHWAR